MKKYIACLLLAFSALVCGQGVGTVESQSVSKANLPWVNIKDFGAVGDGTSHPVSEWISAGKYANLAAIQAVIPDVSSTSDEIDWAATQRALNVVSADSGGTVYIPNGYYKWNRNATVKGSGTIVDGESRKGTWVEFTDNAASGFKWVVGVASQEPYFTHFEDFTIRAKTSGTNTGIGIDARNAGVEGYFIGTLSTERFDVFGFEIGGLIANVPTFRATNCQFVNRIWNLDLAKCDTAHIQGCGIGGKGADKAPGSQLDLSATCLGIRNRNNTSGSPSGPNFATIIESCEIGNCINILDQQSGNVIFRDNNTESLSGTWSIRHVSGNLLVTDNRFANSGAISSDAIVAQTGSGGQHLTYLRNKSETLAAPVIYLGNDNYYSSWTVDVPVQWKNAAGTLEYSATASSFESKNQSFWNSIYDPANFIGKVLRFPRNGANPDDLVYSWTDGAGVSRRSDIITSLPRVIAETPAGVSAGAGGELYPIIHTVPAATHNRNGSEIVFRAFGRFAANTNPKTLRALTNGAFLTSGAVGYNDKGWEMEVRHTRRSQFELLTVARLTVEGQTPIIATRYNALDLDLTYDIALGTTGTAAGDIVIYSAKTVREN